MTTIEPIYLEIGRRIQRFREKKNLTQEVLGGLLQPSVTRASIANIEGGKQRVLLHTLIQIAENLEIDTTLLIGNEPSAAKSVHEKPATTQRIESEMAKKLTLSIDDVKKLTAKIKPQVKVK